MKLILLVTYWSLFLLDVFEEFFELSGFVGVPSKIRTCDPLIKSQMLYRLSYGHIKDKNYICSDILEDVNNKMQFLSFNLLFMHSLQELLCVVDIKLQSQSGLALKVGSLHHVLHQKERDARKGIKCLDNELKALTLFDRQEYLLE
jgi:hypothetical protein